MSLRSRGVSAPSAAAGELQVVIDPQDFSRLVADVKAFDTQLYKALRKRLRDAGGEGVKAVQHRIRTGTSHSNTGLREGLARGTKVSIRTSLRSAGISIVTTGAKLPEAKRAMVRVYNQDSFRHRVFGRDVWVPQRGRPYFGAVLDERKHDMLRAADRALRDAADTIRAGTVGGTP